MPQTDSPSTNMPPVNVPQLTHPKLTVLPSTDTPRVNPPNKKNDTPLANKPVTLTHPQLRNSELIENSTYNYTHKSHHDFNTPHIIVSIVTALSVTDICTAPHERILKNL